MERGGDVGRLVCDVRDSKGLQAFERQSRVLLKAIDQFIPEGNCRCEESAGQVAHVLHEAGCRFAQHPGGRSVTRISVPGHL